MKRRRRHSAVLVLVLLVPAFVLVAADTAAAQQRGTITGEGLVLGEPDIEASIPDNRLEPGKTVELRVTLSNSGEIRVGGPQVYQERVKTAGNVRVSIDEDELEAPIEVKTGTVVLGDLRDGQPKTATFRIETKEGAESGRYSIPLLIEYDETTIVRYFRTTTPPGFSSPRYRGSDDQTVTKEAEVVFESEPRFSVTSSTVSDLYAGDTGVFELTVRNTGDGTARDATVRLKTGSSGIAFGPLNKPRPSASVSATSGSGASELAPGEPRSELVPNERPGLAPGESETVSVKMNAGDETTPGAYPVSVRIEYFNENGVEEVSDRLQTQVRVDKGRRFRIENLRTESLRVDENDAVVRGNIVNTGTATARNVVVTLSSRGAITATGPEAAVNDLEPGESKPVRFDLAVAEDAEPGTRSLTFNVEYENDDGDLRKLGSPVRKPVTVGEEIDTFEIVDVNTSVSAGGSDTVRLRIRNNGEYPVEDANAKVFFNDPLSSSDNSAFLGNMDTGETKTAVFKVSATGEAISKEYDASLEVRYDDRTGDTELADGMTFGVPVEESSGGLPLPFIAAGVAVIVASGAVFVYQRKRQS